MKIHKSKKKFKVSKAVGKGLLKLLIGHPLVTCVALIIVVAFVAYTLYSIDYQLTEIMKMYQSLSARVTDSKSGFDKRLFYVTTDSEGNKKVTIGYSSEVAEEMAKAELNNATGGGGSASLGNSNLTTLGPSTSVNEAGISTSGEKTALSINVAGADVPLYNGIPSEWGASGSSVYIDFKEVEEAWKSGYQETFGHPYPNAVVSNGWHEDSKVNRYSPSKGQSGPTFKYAGDSVVCVGYAPPPYYADCTFRWNGTGESTACYSYKWVLVVKNESGDVAYLPAIPSDAKGHTWPGGVAQTYIQHPSDGGNFNMARGGKSDTATVLDGSQMDLALSYLEDGSAGNGYGTTKNTQVQFSVEGYEFDTIRGQGWSAIGVIRVQ